MATLDITKEKATWLLTRRVNHLVKKSKEIPDKLIITVAQYENLHRRMEVFQGNKRVPTAFLFHGRYNIMEVEII